MPNLVEPGVKYFLNKTLKNTNIKRIKHENFMFNIYLFLGFFVILGIFLYYKFKTKPSQKDLEKREKEKSIIFYLKLKV